MEIICKILALLGFLITLLYCGLILYYRTWLKKIPVFVKPKNYTPKTNFSIIIPARNEAENIANCLDCILNQSFPSEKFEVIVIDDHSTDETALIVNSYCKKYENVSLISLQEITNGKLLNAYKKKAIEYAIGLAKHEWIITTDADCSMNNNWLNTYDAYIQSNNKVFVAASVMYYTEMSFLGLFQQADFMSLQGITAASVAANFHSMCNGANLAYEKKVFFEVNGFKGIDHIASGDDMLLMHKINKHNSNGIGYLYNEDSIVYTAPMPTLSTFLNQRIRWASKADKYEDKRIFWVLAFVYLYNAFLLFFPLTIIWLPENFKFWLCYLFIKTLTEITFMHLVAKYYNKMHILFIFPFLQPFHILYTVVAGWLGKFGTYKWKDRTVH